MPKPGPGSFRLFLALIVVLHHSTPLRLGAWAVGLFFCLSVFWIAQMWTQRYRHLDRPYPEYLMSRWWRVAPVLFFCTLLAGLLMHAGLIPGDTKVLSSIGWWATQPTIAGSTAFGWLMPPAWSLDVEMQFYLIAPLMVAMLLRIPMAAKVTLLIVALSWCWIEESRGSAGDSPRLDIWLGVFLIGMTASVTRWRPTGRFAATAAAIVVTIFAASSVLPLTRSWIILRGATGHQLRGPLAAGLTVGTIILSAPFAIWTTGLRASRTDRFLGDLSYPLYLFHWLPRSWYYTHVHSNSRPAELLLPLVINIVSSLFGAVIILVLIDRPMQQWRARWVKRHKVAGSQIDRTATGAIAPLAGTV